MSGTLDHVMARVEDLEELLDWYTTHLGYEGEGHWEADTFTNVYLGPGGLHEGDAALELTHNHDDDAYKMGDTWGYIVVRAPEDELESSYWQSMDEDVEDYRDPESRGGRYTFIKDPDGHEAEIVRRDRDARWSLDHTMTRIEDTDEAFGFWTRKSGYEHTGRWESDTFADYFTKLEGAAGEATAVGLAYNYDGWSYEMSDAWGHLAVGADDLHDYWKTSMEREAEDYRDPKSCDDMFAFTKGPDGHEIEVIPADFEPPR